MDIIRPDQSVQNERMEIFTIYVLREILCIFCACVIQLHLA